MSCCKLQQSCDCDQGFSACYKHKLRAIGVLCNELHSFIFKQNIFSCKINSLSSLHSGVVCVSPNSFFLSPLSESNVRRKFDFLPPLFSTSRVQLIEHELFGATDHSDRRMMNSLLSFLMPSSLER
jgi:hypothetical protein